jgi:hypothetical protein
MQKLWQKPEFQEVSVNGECTAYSGTSDANQADRRLAEQALAVLTLADRFPVNEAHATDSTQFN